MARPIGVDLFAGAGGMSLGFEQAGFDIVAAVEIDPIHAAVHSFNFPNCATLTSSITEISGKDIRTAAGIGSRKIDVVFGGAPCQGFSLIGHRAIDDPRNRLVRDFVRIVQELSPSFFVFENVKGLTIGKHRSFLEELVEAFQAAGYEVRLPWKVLNASSFGVPQDRERLFLMGARRGLRLPAYPTPITRNYQTRSKRQLGLELLPLAPSCHDALADLPNAELFEDLNIRDEIKVKKWRVPSSNYAKELRCLEPSAWHLGYERLFDPNLLTSSLRTEHTAVSRRRFARTAEGDVEPISRFFKLPRLGQANTLRAGTDAARGAFTSPRPIHYLYSRCVTVREMARLHGFPDWFRFHVTKWHGARQIGNAVPPPLARAIATAVIFASGKKPRRPSERLKLGPTELLHFDMAEASRFWGVLRPIAQRNRKSGAKKRRQDEIEKSLRAA